MGFKIQTEFDNQIQGMSGIPTEALTASTSLTGQFSTTIDNSFLFVLIGTSIVALILASLVRIHPIFIPLFIIVWVFIIFISGGLSNVYQAMAADPQLIAQANQLTFVSNIMNNLPLIIGVLGMLLMIVMYKLWSNDQG